MNIFVSQKIHKSSIDLLKRNFNVETVESEIEQSELIGKLKNQKFDAFVCSVTDGINKTVIEAGRDLKIISNVAVGYDNIDLLEAKKRDIVVANTPNTLEQSVVEFVFAHIFLISRHLIESDKYIRDRKFNKWSLNLFLGNEVFGKTLGIVGFGSIGRMIVEPAKCFGMKVAYCNRSGELEKFKNDSSVKCCSFDEVLQKSNYVVLLTSLNQKTRGLMNFENIQKMKKDAVLINMSRGPVVVEVDLVRALRNKLIKGACLDVFESEPKVSKELIGMRNTILTPHIGSATHEARERMSMCAVQNVIDFFKKGKCDNIINQ